MIVEVRTYRIKPGRRDEFIRFFQTISGPAQVAAGMRILGPLLDVENPNRFIWLRAFRSLDERERIRNEFYEGPVFKRDLEPIAMSMLESYDVTLCETADGYSSTGFEDLL